MLSVKMVCPVASFLFYLMQYLLGPLKLNSDSFFVSNYFKRAKRCQLFKGVQGVKGNFKDTYIKKKKP